jgi:glyoxylase-like metal-dependent hydrolase (beta-lactamase superfamily II)
MARLVPVADGVLVATHPFCTTTTTVVLGDRDGCLIVDPAVTAGEIDALAGEITGMGLRVTAGFSTHPHWDHLLWRDSLGDAPRFATGVGAESALERVVENSQNALDSLPGVDVTCLGRVTGLDSSTATIPWAGPRVEIVEHRAHAPGHAALLIETAGVLVAGDMLSDVEIPLPDRMADDPLGDYEAALDLFAGLFERVAFVVPGHGSVGDRRELQRRIANDRSYIRSLKLGRTPEDERLAHAAEWLHREHPPS